MEEIQQTTEIIEKLFPSGIYSKQADYSDEQKYSVILSETLVDKKPHKVFPDEVNVSDWLLAMETCLNNFSMSFVVFFSNLDQAKTGNQLFKD